MSKNSKRKKSWHKKFLAIFSGKNQFIFFLIFWFDVTYGRFFPACKKKVPIHPLPPGKLWARGCKLELGGGVILKKLQIFKAFYFFCIWDIEMTRVSKNISVSRRIDSAYFQINLEPTSVCKLNNKHYAWKIFSKFLICGFRVLSHFFIWIFLNESLTFGEKKSSREFFDLTALSALIMALKLANFAIFSKNGKKMPIFIFFACTVKSMF